MVVNRNTSHIPRKSYPSLTPQMIQGYFGDMPEEIRKPLIAGLTRIMSKQAVDERLNYDVIERFMGTPRGVGQRSATLVIAADDSSEAGKEAADYICTGTNDQVTILEAIEEIIARSNAQGKIVFLDGTFNVSSSIIPSSGDLYIALEGLGPEITKIVGPASTPTFDFSGTAGLGLQSVRDIYFNGGSPTIKWDTIDYNLSIINNVFEDCPIALLSEYHSPNTWLDYFMKIQRNVFKGCGTPSGTIKYAVELRQRSWQLDFSHNSFDGPFDGPDLLITSDDTGQNGQMLILANNHFRKLVSVTRHVAGTMTGNIFNEDMTFTDCDDFAIAGNTLYGTYTETGCTGFVKAGNIGIV